MNNKKILCFIDGLSSGGAERQLIGLAHYLQLRGFSVEILSYVKRDFYDDLIREYDLPHYCLNLRGGRFRKFFSVCKHIRNGNYETVIAYKAGATFSTCILRVLRIVNHAIVSERNTTIKKTKKDDIKFFLYRFADHIVPNAYSQEAFIKQNYPFLASKITTITNFTDTDYFKPLENAKREGGKILNMLIVAKMAPQKNIFRFLEVVKKLKENNVPISIKWFGSASATAGAYEEECTRKFHEYKLEEYITFYPATTNILAEYQNCDVFCLPSVYEGYPNVVCEAMSCGKPVLCSRVCDNPKIVEEGVNGYMFDPENIEDIYNSIVTYLSLSEEKKQDMSLNSRRIALEKFSPDVFVQKYIELIEKERI